MKCLSTWIKEICSGDSFHWWDDEVDVVLVRDADQVLTPEDDKAVQEWLDSDKDFHIVRYVQGSHARAIVANFFGGRNKVLHPLIDKIRAYEVNGNYNGDQQFLCDIPYPYLRENHKLYVHDDINRIIHLGGETWLPVEPDAHKIPPLNIGAMQSRERPMAVKRMKEVYGNDYKTPEDFNKPYQYDHGNRDHPETAQFETIRIEKMTQSRFLARMYARFWGRRIVKPRIT